MQKGMPIGFWLKELDRRIEVTFERALGDVSRREWQLLNGSPEELRAFEGVDDALAKLEARGWLRKGELTEAGRDAREQLALRVGAVRREMIEGVSAEEYEVTVHTLTRMAANLDV
jgi:hypothetical protein